MATKSHVFLKLDPIAERKRALAKVYSLLLKLSETTENKNLIATRVIEEENIKDSALVQLELSV